MAVQRQVRLQALLLFVFGSSSALISNGTCYDFPKMSPDFDVDTFSRSYWPWYEISRLDYDLEHNTECNVWYMQRITFPFNLVDIDVEAHNTTSDSPSLSLERIYMELYEDEMQMFMIYNETLDDPDLQRFAILSTDIHNYAIMYSCKQISDDLYFPIRDEKAWVVSRYRYFEQPIQDKVDEILNSIPADFPLKLQPVNTLCNNKKHKKHCRPKHRS